MVAKGSGHEVSAVDRQGSPGEAHAERAGVGIRRQHEIVLKAGGRTVENEVDAGIDGAVPHGVVLRNAPDRLTSGEVAGEGGGRSTWQGSAPAGAGEFEADAMGEART